MERFGKIVNHWKLLTIFAKLSSLDIWQVSEYASELFHLRYTVLDNFKLKKFSSRLAQQNIGIKNFMAYLWAVNPNILSYVSFS